MNKFDIFLISIILLISLIIYVFIYDNDGSNAIVTYENKEVLKIDLSNKEYRVYEVDGYNGKVKIETKDGMVKVIEEISPKHLCSRQGYISKAGETIICLPNKVIIKIENDEVDTVVGLWN